MIAAFALGIIESFISYSSTLSIATWVSFLIVVVFLQWRPQGLFRLRTRSLS